LGTERPREKWLQIRPTKTYDESGWNWSAAENAPGAALRAGNEQEILGSKEPGALGANLMRLDMVLRWGANWFP